MNRHEKLRRQILQGASDANINFVALCRMLLHFGFEERISGSHHIFRKAGVTEKVNLQQDGANAKVYQVRQVRSVLLGYQLGVQDDAQV